jgi:hypothetical protein
MSDISEEYYCAGWLIGLEEILWSMVVGNRREFGMGVVTEDGSLFRIQVYVPRMQQETARRDPGAR